MNPFARRLAPLPLLLLSPALLAQEISVSGSCPLRESHTFALGSSVTFTAQESPPLSAAALTPAYSPCEEIRFSGQATGKPPLTQAWAIQGPGGPVAHGATNPFEWVTTASTPAGTYTATFTASNSSGSDSKSASVIVGAATEPCCCRGSARRRTGRWYSRATSISTIRARSPSR